MSENNLASCNLCAHKRFSIYKRIDVCLKLKSIKFGRLTGEYVAHVPCVHAVNKCDDKGYFTEKENFIDVWMNYLISKEHQIKLVIAFGAGALVPKPIGLMVACIASLIFVGKLVYNFIIRKYIWVQHD